MNLTGTSSEEIISNLQNQTNYPEKLIIQDIENSKPLEPAKILKGINIADFLATEIPPQEYLLRPIIARQGLIQLVAYRGIGKTFTALQIAYTVACGGEMFNGRWKSNKPAKVLYVDGEMPAIILQKRLASIVASLDRELPSSDYFRIITPDFQEIGIPDLCTKEGQEAIEEHLDEVSLIILDNLSTLCRTGKENEGESWLPIQQWALSLRSKGIAVLFVHHAGKNGQQRGTSRREDVLDTVISLKRPDDYKTEQGARFEIHFDKARGLLGDDVRPFEAWLKMEGNQLNWHIHDLEDEDLAIVMQLHAQNLSQRNIARKTGLSLSKVNRLIKKGQEESDNPNLK